MRGGGWGVAGVGGGFGGFGGVGDVSGVLCLGIGVWQWGRGTPNENNILVQNQSNALSAANFRDSPGSPFVGGLNRYIYIYTYVYIYIHM